MCCSEQLPAGLDAVPPPDLGLGPHANDGQAAGEGPCHGAAVQDTLQRTEKPALVSSLVLIIIVTIIIIIIEGLSLLQSIPPTTANKQTQAQKKRGSRARKLLGANGKSYRLKLKLKLSRLVSYKHRQG